MRKIGVIFIAFGLALLVYFFFNYWQEKNQLISPLPDDEEIKVIYLTPKK